jgi:hypothetical protein
MSARVRHGFRRAAGGWASFAQDAFFFFAAAPARLDTTGYRYLYKDSRCPKRLKVCQIDADFVTELLVGD